jgi:hypothetical protein
VPTPTPTPAMFATIKLVTAPPAFPQSGVFDVRSLPGASCYIHRDGASGNRSSKSFIIPASGDYGNATAGAAADSGTGQPWPTWASGYNITAVCSLAGQTTTTSAAISVSPWL